MEEDIRIKWKGLLEAKLERIFKTKLLIKNSNPPLKASERNLNNDNLANVDSILSANLVFGIQYKNFEEFVKNINEFCMCE